MRYLRPTDYVVEGYHVDLDLPESGYFTDESMVPPQWISGSMISTFFGRSGMSARDWIKNILDHRKLYLDGERFDVGRFTVNDHRAWRLIDVERFARALAQSGKLPVEELVRVLAQIRLVAEGWGYLQPSRIEARLEGHDPTRREPYAVQKEVELVDDMNGADGAVERRFALGDQEYSIDLTDASWNDLLAVMAPYVKAARKVGSDRVVDRSGIDRGAVRAWARQNGHPIGRHGPIPWHVMDAYLTRETK